MLDESKRQDYLNAMGVTQWQLRSETSDVQDTIVETAVVQPETVIQKASATQDIVEPKVQENKTEQSQLSIKGLKWLNQGSKNKLLVILPEQRKNLSPESRALMSKMLNAIHFLPSETGFATISDNSESGSEVEQQISLDTVKAVLVFGNEAGRQLVKVSNGRVIPGTEAFDLGGLKIVVTFHPEEVGTNPNHKKIVWNDLKLLVELFNSN